MSVHEHEQYSTPLKLKQVGQHEVCVYYFQCRPLFVACLFLISRLSQTDAVGWTITSIRYLFMYT